MGLLAIELFELLELLLICGSKLVPLFDGFGGFERNELNCNGLCALEILWLCE